MGNEKHAFGCVERVRMEWSDIATDYPSCMPRPVEFGGLRGSGERFNALLMSPQGWDSHANLLESGVLGKASPVDLISLQKQVPSLREADLVATGSFCSACPRACKRDVYYCYDREKKKPYRRDRIPTKPGAKNILMVYILRPCPAWTAIARA